jgi:choline dehydrogenase-like flavoprotein
MPLANVKWTFSAEDRASVLAFFDTLGQNLQALGLARMYYERLKNTPDWPLIGIHSHFMGTTRMGDDPATSVTNRDCRIHGSDNVFITGPALFPTCGYANPVYTIAALSLRLADHLKTQ